MRLGVRARSSQARTISRPPTPLGVGFTGGLNGFTSATATAAHEPDQPISLSSPLVRASLAALILYSRSMFPIPTTPAGFDQGVIDVGAIGPEHIGKGTLVLVEAMCLEQ